MRAEPAALTRTIRNRCSTARERLSLTPKQFPFFPNRPVRSMFRGMTRSALRNQDCNRLGVGALLALAAWLPALQAGPVGLNIAEAEGYNLVTWDNATLLNSSMQGHAAVGGNASFSGYSLGSGAAAADPSTAALVVGGNLTATNGSVSGGSIYTGGTYTGPGYNLNTKPGSAVNANLGEANLPFDFASAEAALSDRSLAYAGEAATGSSLFQWSTLTLTGTRTDLNIFDIDSLTLANTSSLVIDVAAGSQVLINVSGTNVVFGNKGISANVGAANLLFNFHEATNLTISGIGIQGSVLASFAHVNFSSGHLNGQLIAKSYGGASWGTGSLGMTGFDNRPFAEDILPTEKVPDVTNTGMLLFGALVLGFFSRRFFAGR